jgi:hypothetical protein
MRQRIGIPDDMTAELMTERLWVGGWLGVDLLF